MVDRLISPLRLEPSAKLAGNPYLIPWKTVTPGALQRRRETQGPSLAPAPPTALYLKSEKRKLR